MKKLAITTALAAAAVFGTAAGASAAGSATATTDLNVRSGPGPQYAPVTVIPNGDPVTVEGCIQGSQWCQIDYDGTTGWAYSAYLTMPYQGQTVVIRQQPAAVPVVTYEAPADAPAAPSYEGELIGRVGDTPPPPAPPPAPVRTYVTDNRMQPVYLQGEVVVGAGVPDTVQLQQVPDYQYDYAYVNGEPVLVDPNDRRIVYVYR